MKKTLLIGLFLFGLISYGCDNEGTNILWSYDQKQETINLVKAKKSKVCYFTKNQLNANFKFSFFHKRNLVFESQVYWEEFVRNEYIDKSNKHASKPAKKIIQKISKIPVVPNNFDYYLVERISDKKIMGTSKK